MHMYLLLVCRWSDDIADQKVRDALFETVFPVLHRDTMSSWKGRMYYELDEADQLVALKALSRSLHVSRLMASLEEDKTKRAKLMRAIDEMEAVERQEEVHICTHIRIVIDPNI